MVNALNKFMVLFDLMNKQDNTSLLRKRPLLTHDKKKALKFHAWDMNKR